MTTEQEAKDMRDALELLRIKEDGERKTQHDLKLATTQTWFGSLNIPVATNRDEALTNFKNIESMIKTETDQFKSNFLRTELTKANEKFKELKKLE